MPREGNVDRVFRGVLIMASIAIFAMLIIVFAFVKPQQTGDFALTDKQVLDKAQQCHKAGMAIQLVYDDEWNVYAVKCVYGGFTGDGRKK